MSEQPVIVIDTREQAPYSFKTPCEVATLRTGDYSLRGFEGRVTIERKSKADAYGTIGSGRARFVKELERMSTFDYAAIVIEASLTGLLVPPAHSKKMSPRSVIGSLLAWSVRYGVHVFFADDRRHAEALTEKLLVKYHEEKGCQASTGKRSKTSSSRKASSHHSTKG